MVRRTKKDNSGGVGSASVESLEKMNADDITLEIKGNGSVDADVDMLGVDGTTPFPNPPPGKEGGGQPALEDIMVSRGGGGFNAIKEFVTGSARPEEYLPRTNVKESEVMDFCDIWSDVEQATQGCIDLHQELWNNLLLRRSIGQSALHMGERMFIGEKARQTAMRAGMFSRANTINRGEQFTPDK